MSKKAKNHLEIVPHGRDRWKLHGYVLGRRIRRVSASSSYLENMREELLRPISHRAEVILSRRTWLSSAQLREAEAATQRAGAIGLMDCVLAAERVLTLGAPKPCANARHEWLTDLAQLSRPIIMKKRVTLNLSQELHARVVYHAKHVHYSDFSGLVTMLLKENLDWHVDRKSAPAAGKIGLQKGKKRGGDSTGREAQPLKSRDSPKVVRRKFREKLTAKRWIAPPLFLAKKTPVLPTKTCL